MRNQLLALLLAVPLLGVSTGVLAQSPVGTWTTVDDKTQKPKSVVEIYEASNGTLSGRVTEVLQSDHGANPLCDKCTGANKDKPVKGMVMLWGVKKKGGSWEGGKILDPAAGKIYSVKMTPTDNGKKMEVRGFMGFSLLGKTQTWIRR